MRTHLFAALVAALGTNVAVAQDDNAISNLISNPILWVSQRTSHHSCVLHRHRSDPCGCSMARVIGRPPGAARRGPYVAGARRST